MTKTYRQLRAKIEVTGTGRYLLFLSLGCLLFSILLGLFFVFNDLEFRQPFPSTVKHFFVIATSTMILTFGVCGVSIGLAFKYT